MNENILTSIWVW